MCPNCHRDLAYPLQQCSGGRCPFCGYKPGDVLSSIRHDIRMPADVRHWLTEKPVVPSSVRPAKRVTRKAVPHEALPRKASQRRYELIESSQDSQTHAVHRNGYTVCGSYTGETFAVRVAIRKGVLLESSWRSMGKGIPSCSRCQRLLGIGQV